ncbi:MAG: pyruvate formate lyase-activating protein [Chloroflexi bacterium]|nr:MAG: pyruvate formate lyase-activating protein [Chloroflexota bacterium]
MRILAVDIGTGTQDILLFDSSKAVENCVKMIMPSPTAILAERISRATSSGHPVMFLGTTMGGGPAKKALSRHMQSGLPAYATREAALTFHDNLEVVQDMGVTIVAPDGVPSVPGLETMVLRDLNLEAIRGALSAFGVDHGFDALAVAVLDHGFTPPGMSNRRFRFDHLRRVMKQRNELMAFAYLRSELPEYLTRMRAVAGSADVGVPLLLLDTGVAAALGALLDREVSGHDHVVTVNIGNSHTMVFHLCGSSVAGLFEHHTALLDPATLDGLITRLVQGTLTDEEVYQAGGHGALVVQGYDEAPLVAVTGPRRNLMAGSSLNPYQAVPYGDTMLAGCYGLVSAWALRIADWRPEIERALLGSI